MKLFSLKAEKASKKYDHSKEAVFAPKLTLKLTTLTISTRLLATSLNHQQKYYKHVILKHKGTSDVFVVSNFRHDILDIRDAEDSSQDDHKEVNA